ncbi:hypothetical protein BN903_125 [Halorubrum sp. AJ67]|nr:hypothetical protein BN903_125 [Halorubrum sp. AJ67]
MEARRDDELRARHQRGPGGLAVEDRPGADDDLVVEGAGDLAELLCHVRRVGGDLHGGDPALA